MKRQTGFTLIELMVVIAILGILSATAVGFLAKYRQRTIGSEALVMMKQLLEGEIIYYLAHNEFFPSNADSGDIDVWHSGGGTSAANQQRALDALKVAIPTGHLLDFNIKRGIDDPATGSKVYVAITSSGGFRLFPNAPNGIWGTVDKTGKINAPIPF